jgi:starvation-inducible DNA-binding protein
MKPNLGLSDKNRKAVIQILNRILADEYVLYTKTRNFHWNVVGPQFNDLHKFFESQYEELNEMVDEVAERARALGGVSLGSLAEFLKQTRLKETAGRTAGGREMISKLLPDHESIIRSLRTDLETCNAHGDAGTADFLTEFLEKHEKMAWMLRSFLG